MAYWLVKSDPKTYSWEDIKKEKSTVWDGVRNYQARNNLNEMRKGDTVLFYHSVEGKEILGTTKVTKESFQDPTTEDISWVAVELTYKEDFQHPVSLGMIKKLKSLENIPLIKQSRLSVMPITEKEFDAILKLSKNEG